MPFGSSWKNARRVTDTDKTLAAAGQISGVVSHHYQAVVVFPKQTLARMRALNPK